MSLPSGTKVLPLPDTTEFRRLVIGLCFLAAVLEGIDIQSMGVAAPLIAKEFTLVPSQVGIALSASLVGLLLGAIVGGRLSDRIGRKKVLVVSICILGLFSLATTVAPNLQLLLLARFLTGLGMGGAFPMLIAITSECAAPGKRATAVSLMYCGMPIGGAVAGAVANATAEHGWRAVFYLGGVGPLCVGLLLALMLPPFFVARDPATAVEGVRRGPSDFLHALFGDMRMASTILLWLSYFFTLLIVYLLLNWVPSLMISNGFSKAQAISMSMMLNLGGAAGSITLGMLMDRSRKQLIVGVTYLGTIASLLGLAFLHKYGLALIAAFGAGFFGLGGQLILYALSPNYYPASARGTGIGSAVAIGRFGAIAGPLVAGHILSSGGGAPTVLLTAIPCLVLASAAALMLLSRPTFLK